jgi:AraC family ethanolamine operon transcriptional activator
MHSELSIVQVTPSSQAAESAQSAGLHRFADVHLYGASAPEWNQRYQQLSPGAMRSSLALLSLGSVQVFRKFMDQRVVQQGCVPHGRICLALPMGLAPGAAPRMQGREAGSNSLFILRGGEEFTLHRPKGMVMLAATFDAASVERYVADAAWTPEMKALLKQPVVHAAAGGIERAQRFLAGLFACADFERGGLCAVSSNSPASEQSILSAFLGLIEDPACDRRQRPASSTGSLIVETGHRMVLPHADAALPSVLDICTRLRASRRTVQNAFRAVAQTTPAGYLRAIRLNGVRRLLLATNARELSVGQAAANWGFDHLSHFAAHYRQLFGELPSQTSRGCFKPSSARPPAPAAAAAAAAAGAAEARAAATAAASASTCARAW